MSQVYTKTGDKVQDEVNNHKRMYDIIVVEYRKDNQINIKYYLFDIWINSNLQHNIY